MDVVKEAKEQEAKDSLGDIYFGLTADKVIPDLLDNWDEYDDEHKKRVLKDLLEDEATNGSQHDGAGAVSTTGYPA